MVYKISHRKRRWNWNHTKQGITTNFIFTEYEAYSVGLLLSYSMVKVLYEKCLRQIKPVHFFVLNAIPITEFYNCRVVPAENC